MFKSRAGQASVEYVGTMLVVGAVFVGVATVVAGPWVAGVGETLFDKILCAVKGPSSCDRGDSLLSNAYGAETGALARQYLPDLVYERGTADIPVDFRKCRERACALASTGPGGVTRTDGGLPATAFVHAVDRRAEGGDLYLQYWLYYPDSFSGGEHLGPLTERARGVLRGVGEGVSRFSGSVAGAIPDRVGPVKLAGAKRLIRKVQNPYHRDDWEAVHVRVHPDGSAEMRSSSHHGYQGCIASACKNQWMPYPSWGRVSNGSHAGHVVDGPVRERFTPRTTVDLIPLETLSDKDRYTFAVSPPWKKIAWNQPESDSTA